MTFSSRTMKPVDWAGIRHFKPEEFAAPDKMSYGFMRWLDQLRELAGVPMTITSSYRTPARNREVGGAADSAHVDVPCAAVDIGERPRDDDPNWNFSRFRIVEAALQLGCRRVGMYADGSLHIDRSEDRRPHPRMWRVVGNV